MLLSYHIGFLKNSKPNSGTKQLLLCIILHPTGKDLMNYQL